MLLSDFKNQKVNSKIVFEEGISNIQKNVLKLDGEIEIYNINIKENEEISNMMNNKDISFLEKEYQLLKILTNIECDVDLKEFEEILKEPREELVLVIKNVFESFYDFIRKEDTMLEIVEIEDKLKETNIVKIQNQIDKNEKEKEEKNLKEEQIKLLEEEWSFSSDYKRMKQILKEIEQLDSNRYNFENSWLNMRNDFKQKYKIEIAESEDIQKIRDLMKEIDYMENDKWE